MRTFAALLLLSLPLAALSAVTGSLVGLYHIPGDVSQCDLIRIDLSTGANTTLFSKVGACTALTTNFPSYSAAGPPGTLLVATESAASVFSVDLSGGTTTPLGKIANNVSDIMTGLAHWGNGITVVTTQYGVWNATDPGQNDLLLPLSGADAVGEGFVFAGPWPTLYVVDEASSNILLVNVEAATLEHVSGLNSPIGSVLNGKELLQEKGYVLYVTPAGGGSAKKILNIPDGPGYPRTNGMAGTGYWWFFDFANLQVADLKAKTVAIVGDGFVAAPRGMGFPIYVPA